MNYQYSRFQRLRWRIGDLIARLLLCLAIIGIVEAGQRCGPGQIPVLEHIATVVTVEGGHIGIAGVPVWGCATEQV